MVTARESHNHQQFSAVNSTNFDHTMPLQCGHNCDLSYSLRQSDMNLRGPDTAQQNPVDVRLKHPLPYKNLFPIENPFLRCSHRAVPCGLDTKDKPLDASRAPKRKFLIFDRSDNNTRLFFSHQISPQNEIMASRSCEQISTRVDKQLLMNSLLEERWDENNLTDEEGGEMHEDTEELNALLYSDSDDEYYDDYDEVTSMARSPFDIEESSKKEKLTEELASCEVSSKKRQRLLNGNYKKSSLNCSESPTNRDHELILTNRERKVKVHEALKVLESIIPGSNSKDPISLIDNAIIYLKAMKIEAEALVLGYLKSSTC